MDNVLYADAAFDRAHHLRRDRAALDGLLRHPGLRVVPFWRGLHLLCGQPSAVFLTGEHEALITSAQALVFLGLENDSPIFACDLSHLDAGEDGPDLGLGGSWQPLRLAGSILTFPHAATLAYARGLLLWHQKAKFCGCCGASAAITDGGHSRTCTASQCGEVVFPRTDPAVIMLVADGDRVLLHRQHKWPEGMWSVLAGFVEPGETLEQAVAREVMEETGIAVTDIRYDGCQPWPFPSSLMVAFTARACGGTLRPDPSELEDARWFSRDELAHFARGRAEDRPFLPPPGTIAGHLLDGWLAPTR